MAFSSLFSLYLFQSFLINFKLILSVSFFPNTVLICSVSLIYSVWYTPVSHLQVRYFPLSFVGFVYFGYCLSGNSCWTLSIAFSDADFFFFFCRFPKDLSKVLYCRYIFTFSPIPFKYFHFSFHVICIFFQVLFSWNYCIRLLDWTHIFCVSCLAGRFFIHWAILKSIKTKSVFI